MKRFWLLWLLPLLLLSTDAQGQLLVQTKIPTPEPYVSTAAASFSGKSCGSANLTIMTLTDNRRQMTFYNGMDQPAVIVLNGVQALYLPAGMVRTYDMFANSLFFGSGMTIQACYPGSAPTTSNLITDGVF